ncbi:hypothetical protein TNCT_487061 [Trichonephila clavata]|uniref:Uncharacterized protein n=1 Tax=Trichonephila clavata TaxID=2740835 RepID=A0A8X6GFU9_TRICU|nr:hypothetical protein TNCT_487061 [Trichonephila clavata]
MAESTNNAIPNKKNSQKHVVIIPIDVHHRHNSQVSQILDPDKASDITKAQQKNLEDINATCKRTQAKRMRDLLNLEKVRIQSTSDSSSVVHHQVDEILQADDNLNSSHEFFGLPCQDINAIRKKTSAERMREYKRRKINVVESNWVQEPQHQLPYVEGNEDATLSNYSDFIIIELLMKISKLNLLKILLVVFVQFVKDYGL